MFKRLKYIFCGESYYTGNHSCTETLNSGIGQPCSLCREQFLEESTRREHQKYQSEVDRTITLKETDPEFLEIKRLFEDNCSKKYVVHRIDKNNNNLLLAKYNDAKRKNPNGTEKMLYHGAKRVENHRRILDNGFLVKYAAYGMLGTGVYFADNVKYSDAGYVINSRVGNEDIRTILLCKVFFVPEKYNKQGDIQVIFDETLCFPQYLVHYKEPLIRLQK